MPHHHHHHNVPDMKNVGTAFWGSVVLNVVFVLAEVFAGLMYKSVALLTDAGHNLGDVVSLLLSLLAFRLAKVPANSRFTFGFKKTTIIASLVNAVILFIGIAILGYETVHRFSTPHRVEGSVIAWVAGVGIFVNGISAYLFHKHKSGDLNVKGAYLHLLADALVSFAVVVAGVLIRFTGWYILDPLIALVVLMVILVGTWPLLVESFKLSIGAVPAGISVDHIKDLIKGVEYVEDVFQLHIWATSTTENALTAHVRLSDSISFDQKMRVIKQIRHKLLHDNIQHTTIELAATDEENKNEDD